MWEIVACGAWLSFTGYILWFTFGAKKFQPMTLEDLALIWRIHKHQNGCRASQIHDLLVKEDEVVGFNCDCGYQYLQKRLITQKIHPHAQNSKPLLVPELEISPQQIICLRQDLRLRYLNIKRI